MKFEINQELLEKVVNYLATQPYREVVQLIADINKGIKPIEEKEEAVKPVKGVRDEEAII